MDTIARGLALRAIERVSNPLTLYRDPSVLWEDDFRSGPQGWAQLMHINKPAGMLTLDEHITYNGSPYSLRLNTGDFTDTAGNNFGSSTAIKRLGRGANVGDTGKIYAEAYFACASNWGETRPRALDFGIDQADPLGNRRYFKARWSNLDPATNARSPRLQLLTGALISTTSGSPTVTIEAAAADIPNGTLHAGQSITGTGIPNSATVLSVVGSTATLSANAAATGSAVLAIGYADIPDAAIDLGNNENKRNLHHMEIIFDIEGNCYDGLRLNGRGFGSLAEVSDGSLRAYRPAPEYLVTFASGFNVAFDLRNRVDTAQTRSWANLAYSRGIIL